MKPCVKWVGGKRKIVPLIKENLPSSILTYYEPFFGGGALLFELQPEKAVVSDLNEDLMNMYSQLKENADAVINILMGFENTEEAYYRIRMLGGSENKTFRAARFLYLSRAGFNGLYRVNKKGVFNVAYGKYKALEFNAPNLREVGEYLKNVSLCSGDYKETLKTVKQGDFVYLDPPYYGTFTGYTSEGFGKEKLIELKEVVDSCVARGANVLMSNSAHEDVIELFSEYNILDVSVAWTISRKGASRSKKKNEILVKTY